MTTDLTCLYERAASLAGRPVEVEPTTDGKFIVIWFNHNRKPPPLGDTEEEALMGFIAHLELLAASAPEVLPSES